MLAQLGFARCQPVEIETLIRRRPDITGAIGVERRLSPIAVERLLTARHQLVRALRIGRVLSSFAVLADDEVFAILAGMCFQQRVLRQLLGQKRFELEVAELQELDCLRQLRGEDQRLRLAEVEARTQSHRRRAA